MTARLSDPMLHEHLKIQWYQSGAKPEDIKRLIYLLEEFSTYYTDPWVESYDIELNDDGNLDIYLEDERLSYRVTLYK